jgi:hypothetical protein
MAEKIFGVLPQGGPPTTFQHQQHEIEECRMLPQLWQPRRPIAAVRNGWPALPELTPDQLVRFGGGLDHMVRRLYAAFSGSESVSQVLQVEMLDTLKDMRTIAASAPLNTEGKDARDHETA